MIRFVAAAEAELEKARRWYDDRVRGLGVRFLDEVARTLEAIEADGERLPREETNPDPGRDVRRAGVRKFPFRIVFELSEDSMTVLAVVHDARRPGYWASRVQE